MAFSGLHVVCAYAGGDGFGNSIQALINGARWSQTMASPGTTNEAAPGGADSSGNPVFRIRASADSFVAIGPNPNASTGTRYFIPANETHDIYVNSGDKLAWILA